ncbi:MAG: CsgG/HfaB family protein [Wenzhouxiangella sp.]|nr:CsgG/HfaB family protein [Wenzhouxiangella sp.]
MKKLMKNGCRIVAAGALLIAASQALAEKPVLGVAEFKNESGAGWWGGGVGWDLSGMLSNELASIGAFRVVERSNLQSVLNEQDLGASGRVRPDTAARMGQLTGAQYIVLGTVTAYDEQTSSTGGGISFRGIGIGGRKTEAYLAVDLRVVDANTGEIAHARTIEGRAGGGGINLSAYRGGFGGRLSNYEDTPAGEAIRAALMEITDYLECAMVIQSDRCLAKYEERDDTRRERTRSRLRF